MDPPPLTLAAGLGTEVAWGWEGIGWFSPDRLPTQLPAGPKPGTKRFQRRLVIVGDSLLMREGARLGGSKETSGSDGESSAHSWLVCRESADLGDFRSPGNCTFGLCFRRRPSRMQTVLPVVPSPVLPLLSQCSFLALLPALAPSPLIYIAS